MWGGDGGGLQKRVFLGCKKHAFSGSEEEPKKPPADPKKKIFLRGGQKIFKRPLIFTEHQKNFFPEISAMNGF